MHAVLEKNKDGSIRIIKIQLSNGDVFKISEDIENHIEITKAYSDLNESINIHPRYSNQVCVS